MCLKIIALNSFSLLLSFTKQKAFPLIFVLYSVSNEPINSGIKKQSCFLENAICPSFFKVFKKVENCLFWEEATFKILAKFLNEEVLFFCKYSTIIFLKT